MKLIKLILINKIKINDARQCVRAIMCLTLYIYPDGYLFSTNLILAPRLISKRTQSSVFDPDATLPRDEKWGRGLTGTQIRVRTEFPRNVNRHETSSETRDFYIPLAACSALTRILFPPILFPSLFFY